MRTFVQLRRALASHEDLARDLEELVSKGVLERDGILKGEQVGRERVYLNPRLLEVLRA